MGANCSYQEREEESTVHVDNKPGSSFTSEGASGVQMRPTGVAGRTVRLKLDNQEEEEHEPEAHPEEEESPELQQHLRVVKRATTRTKTIVKEIEMEKNPEKVDVKELRRKALENRMATACTKLNKDTQKHEFLPLSAKPLDLGIYGIGVQIYFQFTFGLGLIFVLLTVLQLPLLSYCGRGTLIDDLAETAGTEGAQRTEAKLSLANLGTCRMGSNLCTTMRDLQERPALQGTTMRLSDITPWLGLLDGLGILFVLLFTAVFQVWWVPREEAQQDEAHVTAADYAVCVRLLPRKLDKDHQTYETELKLHFQSVLQAAGVAEAEAEVEEVAIVREYDGGIEKFMAQGEALEQLRNAKVGKHWCTAKGDVPGIRKWDKIHTKVLNKVVAIEDSLKDQATMKDEDRLVCGAYIMFSREDHKDLVLQLYRTSRSFLSRLLQNPALRFHRKRIKVTEACEPTDLFWENLDFHPMKRKMRKWMTRVAAWGVLVVCILILVYFKSVNRATTLSIGQSNLWLLRANAGQCIKVCGAELSESLQCEAGHELEPAGLVTARGLEWGSLAGNASGGNASGSAAAAESASAYLRNATGRGTCWASPACGGAAQVAAGGSAGSEWLAFRLPAPKSVRCMRLEKGAPIQRLQLFSCDFASLGNSSGLQAGWQPDDHCLRMLDVFPQTQIEMQPQEDLYCTQPVSFLAAKGAFAKGEDPVDFPSIRCFCATRFRTAGRSFQTPPYDTEEKQICKPWSQHELKKLGFLVVAVVIVVVINQILLLIFTCLDKFARYCTATALARNQMINLMGTQVVNLGVLTLIVSLNFRTGVRLTWLSIGQGPYDDLDATWFVVIGASIIGAIAGQVLCSIIFPLIWGKLVIPLTVKFAERDLLTQTPLNDVYEYPDWCLSIRLAETMTIVFCILLYAGGLPLLYIIGAIYCFLAYWVDKWSLLRVSRQPPSYNSSCITIACNLLPFACASHAVLTMFFYGNQDVFPSDWGPLSPVWQIVVGLSSSDYDDVMETFQYGDGVDRDQVFNKYLRARVLDWSRKGNTLLLIIFLVSAAYYAFLGLGMPLLRCLGLWKCCRTGKTEKTVDTYAQAKQKAELRNLVFSYKLSANKRYKEAWDALFYDPDTADKKSANKAPARSLSPLGAMSDTLKHRWAQFEEAIDGAEEKMLDRTEEALRGLHKKAMPLSPLGGRASNQNVMPRGG